MSSKPATASPNDFFYNLDQKKQHIIALLILFLIPLFLFTATTIGGKELQRHDITQWRASAESIFEYRETYGEEPLWSTNMFGGMPSFVVSTKNTVPHFVDVESLFKSIYPAFQFWVLLSGIYMLLVLMDFRTLSAVFGSLLFGLTTYIPIIITAGHNSKFRALAYITWVIAAYWLITRKDKKLSGLLLFSVAFTAELSANHPQITYYFFYLLFFIWIYDSWVAYKENRLKDWGVVTAILAVGVVIGIFGHAPRFLPLQEYTAFSIRGGSAIMETTGLGSDYAFAWSQGIKETFTLIVPEFMGGASPEYWGGKSFTSGPHYLGALALPFLLIGLFRKKSPYMWIFFSTGVLAILFAWGGNFRILNEFAFDYIPLFDKFRAPETWLILTAFCFSIVAVYGFDWLGDWISQKKKADLKPLYVPLGLTVVILAFLFIQVNSMNYTRPGEVENIANQIAQQNQVSPENPQVKQRAESYVQTEMVPERKDKAKSDLLRLTIFLIIGGAVIYLVYNATLSLGWGMLILVLLTAFDMINVGKRYIPDNVIVAGNVDAVQTIESQRRDFDTFIEDHIAEDSSYPYRVLPLLDNPFSNAIPSYFYPTIGGYNGAKLSIIQDVIDQNGPLFKSQYGLNPNLLSLLNVKYLTYQPGLNIPGFEAVFQGEGRTVYENQNVLPKAYFVDSVITVQDPKEAYNFLNPGEIDFAKTAVVETSESLSSKEDTTSSVEVSNYTGPEISMNINRAEPGFLVLSEIYYPAGWIAELNGEEIPIYKTNYLLRGMEIPAGEHELELRFEPQSYHLGIILAWISLVVQLLLATLLTFIWFKNRKESGA
ncbi:MAG: YfhO family protein [Balneolaceae bacterium]